MEAIVFMSSRQTDRYFPSQESMFLLFLVYVWSFSFLGTWPVIHILSQRGFILATLCNEKTPVNCFLDRSLYLRLRILKRKSNFFSRNNQGLVVLVNRSESCNFHSWVQDPHVRPSKKCQKPTRLRYIYSR